MNAITEVARTAELGRTFVYTLRFVLAGSLYNFSVPNIALDHNEEYKTALPK